MASAAAGLALIRATAMRCNPAAFAIWLTFVVHAGAVQRRHGPGEPGSPSLSILTHANDGKGVENFRTLQSDKAALQSGKGQDARRGSMPGQGPAAFDGRGHRVFRLWITERGNQALQDSSK
jgi:hypothetical protein